MEHRDINGNVCGHVVQGDGITQGDLVTLLRGVADYVEAVEASVVDVVIYQSGDQYGDFWEASVYASE